MNERGFVAEAMDRPLLPGVADIDAEIRCAARHQGTAPALFGAKLLRSALGRETEPARRHIPLYLAQAMGSAGP